MQLCQFVFVAIAHARAPRGVAADGVVVVVISVCAAAAAASAAAIVAGSASNGSVAAVAAELGAADPGPVGLPAALGAVEVLVALLLTWFTYVRSPAGPLEPSLPLCPPWRLLASLSRHATVAFFPYSLLQSLTRSADHVGLVRLHQVSASL